jgi:hypothetical protein
MKKIILLFLLLLCFCKKEEPKYCWDCVLEIATMSGDPTIYRNWIYSTSKTKYCDKTQEEIDKMCYDRHHDGNQYRSLMVCTKIE